jgi:hypothetical protein
MAMDLFTDVCVQKQTNLQSHVVIPCVNICSACNILLSFIRPSICKESQSEKI